jgi:hypothetical protein
VFHSQTDEFITCHSCEFRYPQSRGMCVMCGAPAQTAAPLQVAPEPSGSNRAREEAISRENLRLQQTEEGQRSGKSIGIGIAVAVVLLMPVFLVIHNWQTSKSTEPIAAVTSTQPQGSSEEVAVPDRVAKKPVKAIRPVALATQQVETAIPVKEENDPAELWKSVRSGSARAEVTLAKLYLDGNTVPQSCEQTHMLLLAASKKGYKAADSLLTGAYVERCQQSSIQQNGETQ